MMFKKCQYYNNHHTCCSLMIDDVVPLSISYDGEMRPWNDWGFGKKNEHSLFQYLDTYFFQKYPEIKGTFFIPFESQNFLPEDSGMKIQKQDFDSSFNSFFASFEGRFDIGFHGIKHTWFDENSMKKDFHFEFSHLRLSDADILKEKIREFEQLYGIRITGGKFPGYHRKNDESFDLLSAIGMKWWAYTLSDNKIGKNNFTEIQTRTDSLIDIPSNLNGGVFNQSLHTGKKVLKNKLLNLKGYYTEYKTYNYLDHLYANRLPITIQEHSQNQSVNGKRQKPNLFDDLKSLETIFSILRGMDIWYAECSKLAHYQDSFLHTEIVQVNDRDIRIAYTGKWDGMFTSFQSDSQYLKEALTGVTFEGILKSGSYIFNDLKPGNYTLCH